ncbi:MAG: APC family permease [Ignavibacteriales bacterium]|nr:APC family permease [Ignavibacteriales bacterium]
MNEQKKELQIFPRPASGLVKAIGTWGAILFGIHCISLSSSGFIPFSWVASVWPGASIIGLLFIAMITSTIHGYTFASIGIAMPRPGADYVLASRILHPIPAFMASWTLVIFSGVVAGGLIAWIPKSALPALLQPMSIIFNDPTYSSWATYASTPQGSLIIGTICVVITYVLMVFPNRIILWTLAIGLVLGLLAWGIIFYSLIDNGGAESFRSGWNTFMASTGQYGSFDKRIELAEKAGMMFSASTATMTMAGLIMGFWIFYGYYIPTFFAGEVRKADTTASLIKASLSSIFIAGAIFIAGVYLLERLVDERWIAAEGFIFNNPDAVAKAAGENVTGYPWITFYAAILKPKFFLVLLTAFAWVFTLINLAQTYFFYASRIVFSWSLDRVVPEFLAYVHPRTNSPIISLVFIAILAEIGVIDASQGGPLGTQLTFAFFAVVTQLVSVVAIIVFPYKAKAQFDLCPEFIKKPFLGVPRITFFGIITLVYLIWMIIASFLFPAVGVANPINTLLLLMILLFTGYIVFIYAKWHRKKYEDIDISLIYKTAPPA